MSDISRNIKKVEEQIINCIRNKELNFEVKNDGTIITTAGTTAVMIRVMQFGDSDRTIVRIISPVAIGIERVTPELTRLMVELCHDILIGKFSLDTDNNAIWCEYVVIGDHLDDEELFIYLSAVVLAADKYDERLSEMSGGKKYRE